MVLSTSLRPKWYCLSQHLVSLKALLNLKRNSCANDSGFPNKFITLTSFKLRSSRQMCLLVLETSIKTELLKQSGFIRLHGYIRRLDVNLWDSPNGL
jgi:hypothetical protein